MESIRGGIGGAFDDTVEIKEQMYQDKLTQLRKQLDDLDNGVHTEFLRRVGKLEMQYNERIRLNEVYREYLVECVERDYIYEKRSAAKEFDEKKEDLKFNLLTDFEDRRKLIDTERQSMELTSDSTEVKPTVTRKLRRRPNEPLPVVEKRRKPTNGQLILQLDDKDVENDLKSINRAKGVMATTVMRPNSNPGSGGGMGQVQVINGSGLGSSGVPTTPGGSNSNSNFVSMGVPLPMNSGGSTSGGGGGGGPPPSPLMQMTPSTSSSAGAMAVAAVAAAAAASAAATLCPMSPRDISQSIETKIEDGKLLYERRWFHRGQPVFVEGKDMPRFPGIISAINDVVWVKRLAEGTKIKINTNQLSRGKVSIKRRAS